MMNANNNATAGSKRASETERGTPAKKSPGRDEVGSTLHTSLHACCTGSAHAAAGVGAPEEAQFAGVDGASAFGRLPSAKVLLKAGADPRVADVSLKDAAAVAHSATFR